MDSPRRALNRVVAYMVVSGLFEAPDAQISKVAQLHSASAYSISQLRRTADDVAKLPTPFLRKALAETLLVDEYAHEYFIGEATNISCEEFVSRARAAGYPDADAAAQAYDYGVSHRKADPRESAPMFDLVQAATQKAVEQILVMERFHDAPPRKKVPTDMPPREEIPTDVPLREEVPTNVPPHDQPAAVSAPNAAGALEYPQDAVFTGIVTKPYIMRASLIYAALLADCGRLGNYITFPVAEPRAVTIRNPIVAANIVAPPRSGMHLLVPQEHVRAVGRYASILVQGRWPIICVP